MKRQSKLIITFIIAILFLVTALIFTPRILVWSANQEQNSADLTFQYFPVTVNPKDKTITENEQVNIFLADQHSLLGAAMTSDVGRHIWNIIETIAITINNTQWYQNMASTGGKFVTIEPGMRKEQVASAFGDVLSWNSKQMKTFMTPVGKSPLPLSEGSFSPGLYQVFNGMTPAQVQTMVDDRFANDVLSHYGTSTEELVPLSEALTIASIIQRETISTDGMRLLSGIIWNRLFTGMNLQIDSTLQYAKANKPSEKSWWPAVTSNDKYIASPYNTYLHSGLPPTPISNPSVDAILAALNPVSTPCLYYFNDKQGVFHCSDTYAEHVALLKKYYGN